MTQARFTLTQVQAEQCRRDLRAFAKAAWHVVDTAKLVWSWHLDALADHLAYIVMGEIRFLWVNMPPRTTKSMLTGVLFPPWVWIQDTRLPLGGPGIKFLTGSYALGLSQDAAVLSRDLIDSDWYQSRWGHKFRFAFDEKTKRQYRNDKGGTRIVTATDATTTGKGGNIILIDDPHNAKEIESEKTRQGTHRWWDHSISSRLNQPDKDAWILNGQRTGEDDLFGHIDRHHDTSQVVKLILPNEFDPSRRCITFSPKTKKELFRDPRKVAGELLIPGRIGPDATKRLKRTMQDKYKLQYQQDPKGGGGRILKRESWRKWAGDIPECEVILSVYDSAFDEGQQNDYSARTDWGIFKHRETQQVGEDGPSVAGAERRNAILLGAWRAKVPYHELRREAKAHYLKVKPDYVLVEKKATGIILCQDLARAGVRGLRRVSLAHGRAKLDKVERANMVSGVLDDGLVWYPDRQWAEKVIDECSAFPEGSHDDFVDTVTMALQFLQRLQELSAWEPESEDGTVRLFKRIRPLYG